MSLNVIENDTIQLRWRSVVTTCLFCAVFDMLALLRCMWLPVTSRSPSVSITFCIRLTKHANLLPW